MTHFKRKYCTFAIYLAEGLATFLEQFFVNWAIPEIRCTPPKEDMGIPKILTTFFIGNSKKIKPFFSRKGKEGMGIPKIFNHF